MTRYFTRTREGGDQAVAARKLVWQQGPFTKVVTNSRFSWRHSSSEICTYFTSLFTCVWVDIGR